MTTDDLRLTISVDSDGIGQKDSEINGTNKIK